DALERLGHEPIPIDVGADLVDRLRAERPDVAFVALHGQFGEDGTVQELLEVVGVPYTAPGVSACIRCADKVLAKHAMRDAGIPTPDFYALHEIALDAYRLFGCYGFARVDLMMETGAGGGELFVLEVNAIPGLTETSLLPQAAEAAGVDFDEVVARLIELALARTAPA